MKIYMTIQNIILTIVFFIYGLLDSFDMFDSISVLKDKSDSLMLVAMSIFLFTHLIERNININNIESSTDKTLKLVSEIASKEIADIITFDTSEELYNYMAHAVRHAKKSISDLTWGATFPSTNTEIQQKALSNYFNALLETINKTDVMYKEVMTFPEKRRLHRVKTILEKGYKSYHLKYYNITPEEHIKIPPLLQFIVIDDSEVILHVHRGTVLEPSNQPFIATKNRYIVKYFADYYNAIWTGGIPLIDTTNCDIETIDSLINSFDEDDKIFEKIYSIP